MFKVSAYSLLASILVLGSLFIQLNECRPPSIDDDNSTDDYEDPDKQQQQTQGITQSDLLNNGMKIDETKAVPVLIEVPDTEGTPFNDDQQSQSSLSDETSELSPAESAPNVQFNHYNQQRRPMDLKAAASHKKYHKKHGAKGWLDMGAWTSKKGAFGWYDKHPVGKGK